MARLNIERQKDLEPLRIGYAKDQLAKLGFEIIEEDKTTLKFIFNGEVLTLFPYSGWHSGKSIVAGRGIHKLLKQLELNNK